MRAFPGAVRLAMCLLLCLAAGAGVAESAPPPAELPPLPALTNPPTGMLHPGKFVWADLFSDDVATSERFYETLLGWELRWISEPPNPYGIFSADGYAVAGLAYRDVEGQGAYARWVHYLSVTDMEEAVGRVRDLGGRVLLERSVAQRGDYAIFSAVNEVLMGLMTSSSGDPGEVQSLVGEWIWRQLYVTNVDAALAALKVVAPYEFLEADSDYVDVLLASGGYARGGVSALSPEAEEAPTWIGFVRVADVSDLTAEVPGLGGRVLFEAVDGAMAIIADPGGALVGLVEYSYPEAEEGP